MYQNFVPGDILSRPKGFVRHKGMALENGLVYHNTPNKGEHISSVEDFAKGKHVRVEKQPLVKRQAALQRLHQATRLPKEYKVLTNNCEHSISRLLNGISTSPQLRNAVLTIAIATIGYQLIKKAK